MNILIKFLPLTLFIHGSLSYSFPKTVSTIVAADEVLLSIAELSNNYSWLYSVSLLADNARFSQVTEIAKKIKIRSGNNWEATLAQQPELIVTATFNMEKVRSIAKSSGVEILELSKFQTIADIEANVRLLAKEVKVEAIGENLIQKMHRELNEARKLNCRVRLLIADVDGSVFGTETIPGDLIEKLGHTNVARDLGTKGWAKINPESLAKLKVDALVIPKQLEGKRDLHKDPTWKYMPAVEKKHVVYVGSAALFSTSHLISNAAKAINLSLFQLGICHAQ